MILSLHIFIFNRDQDTSQSRKQLDRCCQYMVLEYSRVWSTHMANFSEPSSRVNFRSTKTAADLDYETRRRRIAYASDFCTVLWSLAPALLGSTGTFVEQSTDCPHCNSVYMYKHNPSIQLDGQQSTLLFRHSLVLVCYAGNH
jgi:hypothetical protein